MQPVSYGNQLYNTTALVPARRPSSEIIRIHVHTCVPCTCIAAATTIQGRCLVRSELLIVQLLFEGGVYSREASIRGWSLFEGGFYSRVASIRGRRLFEYSFVCS